MRQNTISQDVKVIDRLEPTRKFEDHQKNVEEEHTSQDRQVSRTVEIPISAPTPSGDEETLMDVDAEVKRNQSTTPPQEIEIPQALPSIIVTNMDTTSGEESLNPLSAPGPSHATTQPDKIMESAS